MPVPESPVVVDKHLWFVVPERDAARSESKMMAELVQSTSKWVTEENMASPTYMQFPKVVGECPLPRLKAQPAEKTKEGAVSLPDVCPVGHVMTAQPWKCNVCVNPRSHKGHTYVPGQCRLWSGYGLKGG